LPQPGAPDPLPGGSWGPVPWWLLCRSFVHIASEIHRRGKETGGAGPSRGAQQGPGRGASAMVLLNTWRAR